MRKWNDGRAESAVDNVSSNHRRVWQCGNLTDKKILQFSIFYFLLLIEQRKDLTKARMKKRYVGPEKDQDSRPN